MTVGQLFALAAVAGILVAVLLLPVVAKIGSVVRTESGKVTGGPAAAIGAVPLPSKIFDSSGHLLASVYEVNTGKNASASGVDRQPVSYSQIAPVMLKAIVAIEDDRYWTTGALDLRGTIRAAVNDIQGRPVQGGSTIAQQYVKEMQILAAPNPQQAQAAYADTVGRKLRELRLAISLEHQQSKQQILTGYLNDAYFGNLAYGVQVAALTYFGTTAARLTLPQAATLAGIVENPSLYDPITSPGLSTERRNTVLARMAQTGVISAGQAQQAEDAPLTLHPAPPANGCSASGAGSAAFFCAYAERAALNDPALGATAADRAARLTRGGLRITTTLNEADQRAASDAVNYILPPGDGYYNPGQLADTEVLIQPGTGKVLALAENRTYGVGQGQTMVDYALGGAGGSAGVQTGSSAKLFTLVTALEQGIPFGYSLSVPYAATVSGYTNCARKPAGVGPAPYYIPGQYQLVNASAGDQGTYTLDTGTTQSINTFYANLEKKVGLCNVVHTAMKMGMTWADGTSLLKPDSGEPSADNIPSFTLGSVYVSPLSMAAAYATAPAEGMYCAPIAISTITTPGGKSLPAPQADCHSVMPATVADAVNHILQGVLTQRGATAAPPDGPGGIGRPAAGKTGTSNVTTGGGTPYAAFGGYTPGLASYTSVFNPSDPTIDTMGGVNSCYRSERGQQVCPGKMYGANAPAQTWHMTFDHAQITGPYNFVPVPPDSPFYGKGKASSSKPGASQGVSTPSAFPTPGAFPTPSSFPASTPFPTPSYAPPPPTTFAPVPTWTPPNSPPPQVPTQVPTYAPYPATYTPPGGPPGGGPGGGGPGGGGPGGGG